MAERSSRERTGAMVAKLWELILYGWDQMGEW